MHVEELSWTGFRLARGITVPEDLCRFNIVVIAPVPQYDVEALPLFVVGTFFVKVSSYAYAKAVVIPASLGGVGSSYTLRTPVFYATVHFNHLMVADLAPTVVDNVPLGNILHAGASGRFRMMHYNSIYDAGHVYSFEKVLKYKKTETDVLE